jgi:hypothetical protein
MAPSIQTQLLLVLVLSSFLKVASVDAPNLHGTPLSLKLATG